LTFRVHPATHHVLAPGLADLGQSPLSGKAQDVEEVLNELGSKLPAGRIAEPEEIA